jgi:ribosomal-protein-alanine N-acetyltransferase
MIEIREMCLKDLPEVARIEKENFSRPWSAQAFADSLKQDCTRYLTVVCDGQIAGYCGYLQSFEEADITNVAVEEKSRNLGIGYAMLQELMRQGEERGITAYTLEVRKSNQAAIHLYEKLGFEQVGIRKNFYDLPTEDAVIMWRR